MKTGNTVLLSVTAWPHLWREQHDLVFFWFLYSFIYLTAPRLSCSRQVL